MGAFPPPPPPPPPAGVSFRFQAAWLGTGAGVDPIDHASYVSFGCSFSTLHKCSERNFLENVCDRPIWLVPTIHHQPGKLLGTIKSSSSSPPVLEPVSVVMTSTGLEGVHDQNTEQATEHNIGSISMGQLCELDQFIHRQRTPKRP